MRAFAGSCCRLALVLVALLPGAAALALSERECRQDLQQLLKEIERNRQHSHAQYLQAINEALTDQERQALKEQMEEIWHEEEQQLGIADQMLRDCLGHVQRQQSKAANQ